MASILYEFLFKETIQEDVDVLSISHDHWTMCNPHVVFVQKKVLCVSKFADRVHVRLWPLSSQLVQTSIVMNDWSKLSQYKAYGISQFGTGVWAQVWTSIQWLLTCTLSSNFWPFMYDVKIAYVKEAWCHLYSQVEVMLEFLEYSPRNLL